MSSIKFGSYTPSEEEAMVQEELATGNELYIIGSEIDPRYPEMYDANTGEQIIIAYVDIAIKVSPVSSDQDPTKKAIDGIIKEAGTEITENVADAANNKLDKAIRQYALLKLEKGNIATTDTKVIHGTRTTSGMNRKVSMKTVYTNSGEQVRLLMADNLGYIKGGKVISTKGMDQIGHFSAKHWSRISGLKGFMKNVPFICDLMELTEMTRAVAEGEKPELPIPIPFANMLSNMVLENTFGDIERSADEALIRGFNKLKSEGFERVKSYLFYNRNSSFVRERAYGIIGISNQTLAEILSGKETNINNVLQQEKYENPDVIILYRKLDNPKTAGYIYLIETLFIY